jgi:hypothetical protein
MTYSRSTARRSERHLVCLDLLTSDQPATGKHAAAHAQRPIDSCRRLLAHGRAVGWTVLHVFPRAALSGSARAIEGLEPLPSEPVLYRTGVSAYSNRVFRQTMDTSPETELIIVSLSLSAACLATALTAHDRKTAVTLVEDIVSSTAEDALDLEAIETLSRSIVAPFVQIARTDDLIDLRRSLRVVY